MTTINMPSIAEIKQQIKDSKARTTQYKSTVDKNFFPFWKMDEGEHAVVRLIPDTNSDNPMPYYVDSFNHTLAIDGNDRKIVCPKTFDRTSDCPICDLSQKYYRENDKDKGRYYWRNKHSFVRLLVLENPLDVKDEKGQTVDYVGRVCTSTFGKQILQSIEEALSEFDDDQPVPWLLDDGYDFTIKKVKMGGDGDDSYMTYAFSKFAHRSSAIAEEYRGAVDLIDFKDMLPDCPPLEKVQNYLDAHLGAVEFEYGPNKKAPATEAASPAAAAVAAVAAAIPQGDRPVVAEAAAPVAAAPVAAAPVAAPVAAGVVPEPAGTVPAAAVAEPAGVTTLSGDSDEDMIAKILNRSA
jgi:hypothetical protein